MMCRPQAIKRNKQWGFFTYFFVILCCLALATIGYAGEKWILWHGIENVGYVPVINDDGHDLVPIDVVASILSFKISSDDKTFLVRNNGSSLELVKGASMAKSNGHNIIPLPFMPLYKEGHWWLEANTALKLLKPLVGDDKELKWAGKSEDDKGQSAAVIPIPGKDAKVPSKNVIEENSNTIVSRNKVKGLRWGQWEDRVRLVVDLSSEGSPFVDRSSPNKLTLRFEGFTLDQGYGDDIKSGDFPEIAVEQKGGAVVIDILYKSDKISYFSLPSPPRYVVDFFGYGTKKAESPSLKVSGNPSLAPTSQESVEVYAPNKKTTIPLVVIDAGHGGKDPGAVANGYKEKDINLKVAEVLANVLKKRGISARLTRSRDIYLRLDERTKLANDWDGDLFVSLHCNALPAGRTAKGIEIYIMALPSDEDAMKLALIENRELGEGTTDASSIADKRTKLLLQILGDMEQNVKIEQSLSFAEVLFKAGKNSGLNMRRVAQAPFFVLRGATMPAVLVEMGFLTDKSEAALLANPNYQKRLAESLADGIESYLRNM